MFLFIILLYELDLAGYHNMTILAFEEVYIRIVYCLV